jgi:hypothetical protein
MKKLSSIEEEDINEQIKNNNIKKEILNNSLNNNEPNKCDGCNVNKKSIRKNTDYETPKIYLKNLIINISSKKNSDN